MAHPLLHDAATLPYFDAAPQHGPRPLPLFLSILRSEAAADPDRMRAALRGLAAYQAAPRESLRVPLPTIAQAGRAAVHDYGGDGTPVLFVPSLINPPHVLDLAPGNSLLRWLATQGLRPLLIDWGTPGADERGLSIAGHVETLLLPLIDAIAARFGTPPMLAGYCLGGTIAIAAAARRPVPALALIAAPWHFAGFPDASRQALADLWRSACPLTDTLGLLPMEVLQAGFWQLDPKRAIDKYIRFAALDPAGEAAREFVALEDWANDGAPLTAAAGRELAEDLFAADLPGSGGWQVAGGRVDLDTLTCPIFDVVSTSDRIVPAASAASLGRRLTLAQGHVGMVVGSRARTALWEPLAQWLSQPHLS